MWVLRWMLTYLGRGAGVGCVPGIAVVGGVLVWCCRSRGPLRCGISEGVGGLCRQCLLEGAGLCVFCWVDVDAIAREFDHCVCRICGFRIPAGVCVGFLNSGGAPVALELAFVSRFSGSVVVGVDRLQGPVSVVGQGVAGAGAEGRFVVWRDRSRRLCPVGVAWSAR